MKTIETTRFGTVAITEEHIIRFADGIIGFPQLQEYVLIESPAMPLVLWLQSVQADEIAFPVAEPWFFKRDYKLAINEADKHSLGYVEGERLKNFAILTIPEDMTKMTVNLRAPIVLDLERSTGTQVVLQDKTLEVRTPAFEAFSKAMSNFNVTQSAMMNDDESDTDVWTAINVRSSGISNEVISVEVK